MADTNDIIGAASAAAQAIQALSVGIGSRKQQARAFDYNMQMQHDAQEYNTMMYDKANEYNSPVQQMARLSEAGLNPNLVYGNSATTTGGIAKAPSSTQGSTGSIVPTSFPIGEAVNRSLEAVQMHHNTQLLDANREAAKAQMVKNLTEASKTLAEIPGVKAQSHLLATRAEKASELLELEMQEKSTQIQVNKAQDMMLQEQANEINYRYTQLEPAQKKQLEAAVDLAYKHLDIDRYNAISQRISANAAQSSSFAANTTANATKEYYEHQNGVNDMVKQRKEFENFLISHGVHPEMSNAVGRAAFSAQMLALSARLKSDGKNPNPFQVNGKFEVVAPPAAALPTFDRTISWR